MQLRQIPASAARPGDFGLTHGAGIFGAMVRFGDRIGHPKPHGQWGHAFLVRTPVDQSTYEAHAHGVRIGSYAEYAKQGAAFFTDDDWTPEIRKAVVAEAAFLNGTAYDFFDIFDAALWDLKGWLDGEDLSDRGAVKAELLGLEPPFAYDSGITLGKHPRALICSVFVAYCWLAAAATDLRDGQPLHRVTPGDLYRTVLRTAGSHDCMAHR